MTDTLQLDRPDVATLDSGTDDQYLGCGCCIRPPEAVSDKVAALAARKARLERQLERLGAR